MPSGPNLAPALKEAPVSKGAPTIATSAFSSSWTFGNLMKVRTPLKRGVSDGLAGSYASFSQSRKFDHARAYGENNIGYEVTQSPPQDPPTAAFMCAGPKEGLRRKLFV